MPRPRDVGVAALLLALLVLPGVLAASSSAGPPSWPQFQRDAGQTGAWNTRGPGTGEVLWKRDLAGGVYATPVPAGNRLLVGTEQGKLVALAPGDGRVLWSRGLGEHVNPSAIVVNGTAYVGAGQEETAVDAADGRVLWRYALPGDIFFSAAYARGLVVAAEENGHLAVLRGADGSVVWNRTFPTAVPVPPRIHRGVLFVGDADGALYALDLPTGAPRWTFQAPSSVYSAPAFAGGSLYSGSVDGVAFALNLTTGHEVWNRTIDPRGLTSSPAVAGGLVVYGTDQEGLVALYRGNGTVAWRAPADGTIFGSPVVTPDAVYYAGRGGYDRDGRATVRAVDPGDGHVLWSRRLGGSVHGSPAAVDGRLLVPVWQQGVVALDAGIGPAGRFPIPAPTLGVVAGLAAAALLVRRRAR